MTVIDDLRNAETLLFGPVDFHVDLPDLIPDLAGVTSPTCIAKRRGELALDLPASIFGIPTDIVIHLVGRVSDESAVAWETDQDLTGRRVLGVAVSRIRGTLVTSVSALEPPQRGNACGVADPEGNTLFKVSLSSTQCRLVVDSDLGPVVLDRADVAVSAGEPLRPVSFTVDIHGDRWESDGCGDYFQRTGTEVEFTALVNHLRSIVTPTSRFEWAVAGGTVAGSTRERSCRVSFPNPGEATVLVRVGITTPFQPEETIESKTLRLLVLTPEEIAQRQNDCRFQKLLGSRRYASARPLRGARGGFAVAGQHFVDPLWDPTPDLKSAGSLSRPRSLAELHQTRAAAEQLAREAAALSKETATLIQTREKQLSRDLAGRLQRPPVKPSLKKPDRKG